MMKHRLIVCRIIAVMLICLMLPVMPAERTYATEPAASAAQTDAAETMTETATETEPEEAVLDSLVVGGQAAVLMAGEESEPEAEAAAEEADADEEEPVDESKINKSGKVEQVNICFAPCVEFEVSGSKAKKALTSMSAADLRAESSIVFNKTDETFIDAADIGEIAVVNVEKALNVRADAGEDEAIIGKLYQNSGVVICGISGAGGEWACIVSGAVNGWVKSEYLVAGDHESSLYSAMEPRVAEVMSNCNVRKEADLESDILAKLEIGARYPVMDIEGDWVRIQISANDEGYVFNEYVSVQDGLFVALPLIEDDVMQEQIDDCEAAAAEAAAEAAAAEEEERENSSSGSSSSSSSSSKKSSSSSSSSSKKSSNSSSSSKKSSSSSSSKKSSDSSKTGWKYIGRCRVTFYCVDCNTPRGSRTTASGKKAREWHTCAVSRSQIPLGSTVKVEGYGTFVAEDTGVGRNQIDLFVDPSECDGLYYRDVWVKN